MKTEACQGGCLPPLPREQECSHGHYQTKAEVVPENMVIVRPPGQRFLRMPRQNLRHDAEAINVWNYPRNRDYRPLPPIQSRRIGSNPSDQEMSDWAHAYLITKQAHKIEVNR